MFSIMLAFLMLSTVRGTLSPCYIFVMLRFCHVVLFSCCTFFVLHFTMLFFFRVTLFSSCTHFMLYSFSVVFLYSCSTLSQLRTIYLAHNSYIIFLYVVLFQTALFSCLHSFHVALFEVASCCICFHQGRLNKKQI